ncbi:tail fiber domain-containing protein [Cupriavidus campinensis]|nr:tail fiber domain-containing protein [Cupriavidus campinensis]
MTKNLIGSDPSQVPTNGSLGTMAFQDAEDVAVGDLAVGGVLKFPDGTQQTTAPVAPAWGNITGKPTTIDGFGITDALALIGGTLTGGLALAYNVPKLTLSDTSQAGGAGIFRWTSAGGQLKLLRNTAATGDFSTSTTPVSYSATDVATFAVRPVFGAATPWDSSNLPNPLDKSGGTMTGMLTTTSAAGAMGNDCTGSLTVKNSGGTGDTDMAMVVFHAPGYWAVKLGLRADGYFGLGGGSATSWRWYVNTATGDMTSAGNVIAYSDETLKENIETIPDALAKVAQLRGVGFNRKDIDGKPRHIGLIAQEVQKVIPEVVSMNADGILGVAYANIVGLLVEAVKELSARVDELEGMA